jgi:hypothetical protein
MLLSASKLIESIINETDLVSCGNNLIEFSDSVYKDKNRASIINNLNEQLHNWLINDMYFYDLPKGIKKKYYICNEGTGAIRYLVLFAPKKTSTVKYIKLLRELGENLLTQFTKPIGKGITELSLNNILQFLDNEYSFSTKVFSKSEAIFILINNSHKIYNSECLVINDEDCNRNLFFLYHMKKKRSISPEAVLFHELGHALHAQYSGDVKKVPEYIIDVLQDLCFPKLKQSNNSEQSELFADVLSVGLMYQTPYEKYDHYRTIHPKDKMVFKEIVMGILKIL